MDIELSFACGRYDRTEPITSGEVQPQGIDLHSLTLSPTETFWRLTQSAEFDLSEMSLSGFIMRVARGDDSYVGLPVFTSRVFRHGDIFLRSDLEDVKSLVGHRIAMPEYHMTAALFMRGLLADEFGLAATDVTWVQAGRLSAGRVEREPLELSRVTVEIDREHTIDELLETGYVTASLDPYGSSLVGRPDSLVRRLYQDPLSAEIEYFSRTGIYPIMHLVVLKRAVYERHPWVAGELYKAFARARDLCLERMCGIGGHSPVSLPFFIHRLEESRQWFGDDLWPYGIEPNRVTLETACRYSFEQGLSDRVVEPEELFADTLRIPGFVD
jgi:4,5-dihydroxyphthalate decarboxylase